MLIDPSYIREEDSKIHKTLYFLIRHKLHLFFVLCGFLITATACDVIGQSKTLNYKIVQNNKVIGWMKLEKNDSLNTSLITLNSTATKRFVFLFTLVESQQTFFTNGIVTRSYIYRRINDDVKVNRSTIYADNYYKISNGSAFKQSKPANITYNQLSLYFFEPLNIREVYSDNYEQYLKIERNGDQNYLVKFPDGNRNSYYYTHGICSKVRVEQKFFTAEFILSN